MYHGKELKNNVEKASGESGNRASDIFQDCWARMTLGANYDGSFSKIKAQSYRTIQNICNIQTCNGT